MNEETLRHEFEIDAIFGGMPLGPGMCVREDGKPYKDTQTEACFKVWARGHASCTVDVRNALDVALQSDAKSGTLYVRTLLENKGLCAKPPRG